MIEFRGVTIRYPDAAAPVLRDVDLVIPEGEFCLVVGATGSGKSTLLGAACGLVPHFSGGRLDGEVLVEGRSTATHPPRELCDVVGVVPQDPSASFVTDTVEEELAYVMENLGVPPADMARRVEDTLDLLDIAALRRRAPRTLSGGQQQRVAIAAVLAASPRVLVLDEPTSALDPAAADDVLGALARLVHDLGLTLLVAEHRLERVAHLADRVVAVDPDGSLRSGTPAEILGDRAPAPPVTVLGRRLGWTPPPVSVRDARRAAGGLRERLAGGPPRPDGAEPAPAPRRTTTGEAEVARVTELRMHYGGRAALDGVDLRVRRGEVLAIMGRNGAGKSTLLNTLAGLPAAEGGRRVGEVSVGGRDPLRLPPRELIARVGLVPQDHGLLLLADTVAGECVTADRDAGLPAGTTESILERLVSGIDTSLHPRDLSEGRRLALALSVILAPAPPLLLLDEPTRGLDYEAKEHLVTQLCDLAGDGHAVVLATHDVELVAEVADRVVVLADGRVVDDGAARDVVCRSPVFAPQMARVLAPAPWLTVTEVLAALDAPDPSDGIGAAS